MKILDEIINHKRAELIKTKEQHSIKSLESSSFFERPCLSLSTSLQKEDHIGIIAEIKRSSPSTGIINDKIDVEQLSMSYIQSGASALSILTDNHFFGGAAIDLTTARIHNSSPVLRKDFMIDEYQIIEAKSIGADCILLIAACLTPKETQQLAAFAKSLNLEVLLEVHSEQEINTHINQHLDIVGINNRNLQNFTTDLDISKNLSEFLPDDFVKISESGIQTGKQIKELKEYGFEGFLIGGHFMKGNDPAFRCKNLISEYQSIA